MVSLLKDASRMVGHGCGCFRVCLGLGIIVGFCNCICLSLGGRRGGVRAAAGAPNLSAVQRAPVSAPCETSGPPLLVPHPRLEARVQVTKRDEHIECLASEFCGDVFQGGIPLRDSSAKPSRSCFWLSCFLVESPEVFAYVMLTIALLRPAAATSDV